MGFFSTKKTYVASTIYNLMGDTTKRPSYMKTLVVGNVLGGYGESMGSSITRGYLNGPGMKLRSFFRWAENNYAAIGVPTGSLGSTMNVDAAIVENEIAAPAGKTVTVQQVNAGSFDYAYFAEQWMFENHPALVGTLWSSDISEAGEITITFEDLTTASFTPVIDRNAVYIYAIYSEVGGETKPLVLGTPETVTEFPSRSGWVAGTATTTPQTRTLNHNEKKTFSYSDGRPNEVTNTPSTTDAPYDETSAVFTRTVYMGADPDSTGIYSNNETANHTQAAAANTSAVVTVVTTETIEGDVVKTTTTETTTESLALVKTVRVDIEKVVTGAWGNARMFIYKVGSGNAVLDGLVYDELNDGEYVPSIPVRLDNKFLSPTYQPAAYQLAKKAYKKSLNGKLDDLIEQVKENESLDEIDYAYVMFGVPLNTKTRNGKEYLYRFFDKCRLSQTASNAEYLLAQEALAANEASKLEWNAWKIAQADPNNPLFGTPEPVIVYQPGSPGSLVHIKSNGTLNTNIDLKIKWAAITETTGTGLKKPDAKKRDVWITVGTDQSGSTSTIYSGGTFFGINFAENAPIFIHWQVTENSWKTLRIDGLRHENQIYKTKSVDITAGEAMQDLEESGFLVPLHMATVREMRLVDSTQMMTAAAYIVFNSKKTVKQKWYQTGWFKVLLFIAIVVITVAFPPAGAAAGSAATAGTAVATAIGVTGLTAAIIAAVVNQIVAMIVAKIIMALSVEIFGAKWGTFIGAIVSFAAMDVGTMAANGASLSQIGSSMLTASNLMQLTMAVGNGVSGLIRGEAMGVMQKNADMMKDFEKQQAELADRFANEFGYDRAMINPLMLTDTLSSSYVESEADFLTRTLLTGSDIAEISMDMVGNFASSTVRIDLRP
jgi:hypothetical protein